MEHFRRKRFLVAAGILVVLVAGLGGCATKRFTDVWRHAPTGIESGEQISIVLRRYEECDPERCKESLSERIETHFASCLTSSAQAVTPALTVVQTSKIRPAAFPDMSFDQFPRSVESWISLFGDADFRQRIRPLNLRYLVLLEVSTGVTSTKTNLGGGSGSFPMWGITRHWEKYSRFKAEILDLKALRSSGVVTSTVRGEAGYMVPVILILPLPPIPYTTATESSGCADIGKAISSFIQQDPTAADAVRRPVNPSTPPPPRWTELRHVGKMSVTDVLPAGELYVATPGVARRDADKDERWLIVEFDVPTAKGEQSYAASITANCLTGELSVDHSMTYLDQRAAGEQVGYHLHRPRLLVKNPNGSLASAVRNICDKTTAQETQASD